MKSDTSKTNCQGLAAMSNVGGLLFLLSLVVYMISGAEGLATVAISAFFLLTVLSAVIIMIGFFRQVFQKNKAQDRLPTNGWIVFGAVTGGLLSLVSVITDCIFRYESGICFAAWIAMCIGCVICIAFGLSVITSSTKVGQ